MEPPRHKDATQADFQIDWDSNLRVQELDISSRDVRNVVKVTYRDSVTGKRDTVSIEDPDSIASMGGAPRGRRAMEIEEGSTSLIDTREEAEKMANAALWDLKDLTASSRMTLPFMPTMDVFTGINVVNPRLSSTNDFYAVEAVEHSLDWSGNGFKASTQVTASGRVVGGHDRWLQMQTRPGAAANPVRAGDVAPGAVKTRAVDEIGDGLVLDEEGVNLRDPQGRVLLKAGRVQNEDGSYSAQVTLYDEDGLPVISNSGVESIGPVSADMYVRQDQGLTPANYIVEGVTIDDGFQRAVFTANADSLVRLLNLGAGSSATSVISATAYDAFGFPLEGISGTVRKAILRLWAAKVSVSGFGVYAQNIGESWSESSIGTLNAPAAGSYRSPTQKVYRSGFVDIDVTSIVRDIVDNKIGNHGFYVKTTVPPGVIGGYTIAMREYSASDYRPQLIVEYGSAGGTYTISPGWVCIQRKLYRVNECKKSVEGSGSAYIGMCRAEDQWATLNLTAEEARAGIENGVVLGRIVWTNGVISSVEHSANTGRLTGYYDHELFWGNRKYKTTDPKTIEKGKYTEILHNLGTVYPTVEIWVRKLGGVNAWYERIAVDTSSYQRGLVWWVIDENRIRIQAGQERAFYSFTSSGLADLADDAQVMVRVVKME